MEIAIPARDIMFEVTPRKYIGIKARTTEIGMVTIGIIAEGMCHRKRRITILTISSSSQGHFFLTNLFL
jgi:hypothetical protein